MAGEIKQENILIWLNLLNKMIQEIVLKTYKDNSRSRVELLNKNGVQAGIHYPIALPLLKAYKYLNNDATGYPVSYSKMNKLLSIPIYPELSQDQMDQVIEELTKAVNI